MDEVLRSPLLSSLPWIDHGFGTSAATITQNGMAALRQIHSAQILTALRPGIAGEGDGLLTQTSNLAVSVRTADCLPILLADTRLYVVAAIHAGWRGTVSRIVLETINSMRDQFGTTPGDLWAAIGPGIGPCCYEVGADVGSKFGLNGAAFLDLAAENRSQLIGAGVAAANIDHLSFCTYCDSRFHSWRRDRERAGRTISFIRCLTAKETHCEGGF